MAIVAIDPSAVKRREFALTERCIRLKLKIVEIFMTEGLYDFLRLIDNNCIDMRLSHVEIDRIGHVVYSIDERVA